MSNHFFVNGSNIITYEHLLSKLRNAKKLEPIIYNDDYSEIFFKIIQSLVLDSPIILLDYDFSQSELKSLGYEKEEINKSYVINNRVEINKENFIKQISSSRKWKVTLYTSGTTGLPKKVTHSFKSITRAVKIDDKKKDNIWGFAYNPTHIAGLQVFFQALLNSNTIVNLFGKSRHEILHKIKKYKVSNISATPSFFRMLLPIDEIFNSVSRITFGGERFDVHLTDILMGYFPNAKILNVYASTEAGTVLAAKGDVFEVTEKNKNYISIINDELLIHSSILSANDNLDLKEEWYCTGDLVQVISNDPLTFKFVQRRNEMINVGGYKVNPNEVEEAINTHQSVLSSRVYSKKNSLLGNIIAADVVKQEEIKEKKLRTYLEKKLQSFKVPRIITFVDRVDLTRSGKIKRI